MALLNVSFNPCNDDNLTLHLFIHGRQYEQIKDSWFCWIRKASLHKQTHMFNTKYILFISVQDFISCFTSSIYLMYYITKLLCIISLTTKFVIEFICCQFRLVQRVYIQQMCDFSTKWNPQQRQASLFIDYLLPNLVLLT